MDNTNIDIITVKKQWLIDSFIELLNNLDESGLEKSYSEFMGVREVCQFTGYKRPTIYSFVHNEQIPYKKNKGKLIFEKSAIIGWMKKSR